MLLDWDKPKKVHSTAEHNTMFMSDSGIAGTYVPNMSKADQLRWKAKIINRGKDNARVEIRKTLGEPWVQLLIIVALDGWDYKLEYRNLEDIPPHHSKVTTRGYNVRISMNGPAWLTFHDMQELNQVVEEAKVALEQK